MRTGKQYGTVSKVNSLGIIELERDEGFTEKISPTDGKYADTERDYLDEAEFPFENLTLRQFVNLASAYKKSA